MIISHRHRFIFIKTQKTAGTSIEIALSRICGATDVITPVAPKDEILRKGSGGRGPQNCAIPFKHYSARDWVNLPLYKPYGRDRYFRARFHNHVGASFIRPHVAEGVWRSYFKFCFDRNPWDKVISWYYFRHPRTPRPTLSEFIDSGVADWASDFDLYSIAGSVVVDRVCRFEDMDDELDAVAGILGLPAFPPLPQAKSGIRPPTSRGYREAMSKRNRRRVERAYAREIETLGYRW